MFTGSRLPQLNQEYSETDRDDLLLLWRTCVGCGEVLTERMARESHAEFKDAICINCRMELINTQETKWGEQLVLA